MEKTKGEKHTLSADRAVVVQFTEWCKAEGYLIGHASTRLVAWFLAQPFEAQEKLLSDGGHLMRAGRSDLPSSSEANRHSLAEVAEGKPARIRKVRSS